MDKYVCPPEYECVCYPRGKSVSRNTMLNHRRVANDRRLSQGLEANLPWGPKETDSNHVRQQYEAMAESTLGAFEPSHIPADTMQGFEFQSVENSCDESSGSDGDRYMNYGDLEIDSSAQVQVGTYSVASRISLDGNKESGGEGDNRCPSELPRTNMVDRLSNDFSEVIEDRERALDTGRAHTIEHSPAQSCNSDVDNGEMLDFDRYELMENNSDDDNLGESAFSIPGSHLSDHDSSESEHTDEDEETYTTGIGVSSNSTPFESWTSECRPWIDLFYEHGLSQVVMDKMLSLLSCPYRSWKTVSKRMCEDSGMSTAVTEYPICPGHMCFYSEEVLACTVCGADRPQPGTKHLPKMKWIRLLPRLQSWFLDEAQCDQIYHYFSSTESASGGGTRDFFDSAAFRRICERYGGEEAVENDVFLGVSTDGFQAFKNKSYDVWPIAAILLNLPPHLRFLIRNVIPFGFIPGPSEPVHLQSFLEPLLEEIEEINKDGGWEFEFFSGHKLRVRVHIMWFTGDLPAVKKMAGLKGHNGKLPCRFCWIEGKWSEVCRHNYYPLRIKDGRTVKQRYDDETPPLRNVEECLGIISELSYLTGQQKADLQISTGIVSGSNAFRLPNILPYHSFPIDIMHLFYNIGKDMLRLWCDGEGEEYSLGSIAVRQIDLELQAFGDGIASEMAARPRPISRYKDWKSAEVKAFFLNYSLVVLDGHLSEKFLDGWRSFVELVDICWRPVLTAADVEKTGVLALEFCRHFEKWYYRYDDGRLKLCKYVYHLLLHLEEVVRESGPPVGYSQYWMERYIGFVVGRLKAKKLAASSLFQSVLFGEAYKMFCKASFHPAESDYDCIEKEGGYKLHGKGYRHLMSYESSTDMVTLQKLRSYLIRKYDGLEAVEGDDILDEVEFCTIKPRLEFLSGSGTQTASAYYDIRAWQATENGLGGRARWYVACEMTGISGFDLYYGRVLKYIECEIRSDLKERWTHWQTHYTVMLIDWASGLELGRQGQLYKNCESSNAFSAATIEDITILRRLISVVDHVVPTRQGTSNTHGSRSTMHRGRKRCYFIDDCVRAEYLLDQSMESADGVNRNLRGRRGQ